MTTFIRRHRKAAAIFNVLLGIALVVSSATAQTRKHPAIPPHPGWGWPVGPSHPLFPQHETDKSQTQYEFLTIDPQGQGHCYVDAHAINNARQVVVDWSGPNDCNPLHASLWDGGRWTSLDFLETSCAEPATYLTSLNDLGIAFGTYWSDCPYEPAAGVQVRAHLWFTLPDIKGFPYNQGLSMSDNGLAVGGAVNDNNVVKHWIWNRGMYLFPAFPAGWDVSAFWAGPLFINNWGQIAGQYVDTKSGRMRGYLQDGRDVTTFDAPGNPSGGTFVNGITDSGNLLLIGLYDTSSPNYPAHSFVWRKGVFTSLPNVPFPDATWTSVFGLNERGDLCGVWQDGSQLWHAYVAFRK